MSNPTAQMVTHGPIKRKDRKCRMCHHPMSEHIRNIVGEVICTRDGCTRWLYCHRKEKSL